MTVVITDCEYRAAVSLVQALGRAGHRLILCHSTDMKIDPPAFASRYAAACHEIDAKVNEPAYLNALEQICKSCPEKPVLLPVGAKTTALIATHPVRFSTFCKTLVAPADILDHANDKAYVQALAEKAGIPVPHNYTQTPDRFPVIVKPACGEKLGLKAAERYARANHAAEYAEIYRKMQQYDPHPLVQEYIPGEGVGVSIVMDTKGNPASILCHRRIREYPVSGGPSTCCETFYDAQLVEYAVRILSELHFVGVAMVEFKGTPGHYKLLEINPRVWGSFPLTLVSGSHFAVNWLMAATGLSFPTPDCEYKRGKRMRYTVNDSAAILSLLKHGKLIAFGKGIKDILSPFVKEPLKNKDDPAPFRRYMKNTIRRIK